jgi:hypothetical protein
VIDPPDPFAIPPMPDPPDLPDPPAPPAAEPLEFLPIASAPRDRDVLLVYIGRLGTIFHAVGRHHPANGWGNEFNNKAMSKLYSILSDWKEFWRM